MAVVAGPVAVGLGVWVGLEAADGPESLPVLAHAGEEQPDRHDGDRQGGRA